MKSHKPVYLSSWSVHDLILKGKLKLSHFPQFCLERGFDGCELNDTLLTRLNSDELLQLENQIKHLAPGVSLAVTNDFTLPAPDQLAQQVSLVKKHLELAHQLTASIVRIYVGGKHRLVRKLWQQPAVEISPRGKKQPTTSWRQRLWKWSMHNRFRGIRQLLNDYLLAQQRLTPVLLNQLVQKIQEILPLAQQLQIGLVIENHGGFSSKAENLIKIVQQVDSDFLGLCPDFGNFLPTQDRYQALQKMMPYALNIHAKSYAFNTEGKETSIDYQRCFEIINAANYQGPVVVEFEGTGDPIFNSLQTLKSIRKYYQ